MKKKIIYLTVMLLSCALVSCNRDPRFSVPGDRGIGVSVSGIKDGLTKASDEEHIASYVMEGSGDTDLVLDVYASANTSLPFETSHATKASIVTTSSINTSGSKFIMDAWLGSENRYPNDVTSPRDYEEGGSTGRVNFEDDATVYRFINGGNVTYDGSEWSLLDSSSEEYVWRNNVPTVFWSTYPEFASSGDSRVMSWPADDASDDDQKALSFSYTNQPAASQKDLLFAYNYQRAAFGIDPDDPDYGKLTDGSEIVSIYFYHALSAIRFDISTLLKKGMTIKSISFTGLAKNGTCSVEGSGTNVVTYEWTTTGTDTTGCSLALASTDFTEKSLDDTTDNALMPLTSGKFLFLMPQEISGKGVKLGITFENSSGVEITKSSELDHVDWEAGKIYTYKLSPSDDKVDVEVLETVTASVKSNVSVKNTGNVKEYLRVSITGNWTVNGEVVLPWSFVKSDFTGFNDTDWTAGADGCFYSNDKVDPDDALDLFTTFTAPSSTPFSGAQLEMYIIAQAVAAGEATSWADAAR